VDRSTQAMLVKLALLGAVGYVLWQAFKNKLSALTALTAPVVNPLADAYVWLTSQGAQIPQGQILLPDGQTWIPVTSVNVRNVPGTSYGMFNYGGSTYYLLTGHDANGNYAASATLNG
jgi:hypothetical protein